MLTRIQIQNFAISTNVEIELENGMTVLSGETGAGKSILIDALNLVLGDRADTGIIRHGSDRATINASFQLDTNSPAHAWLKEQQMDDGIECHLRRVISAEGRSRAFINNTAVNLSSLKTLGEMLVEIHGQHEHQSLMHPWRQRQLLDGSGQHGNLLEELAITANKIKRLQNELTRLQSSIDNDNAQSALLNYQTKELEALHIDELDIPAIVHEYERISHTDSLRELCITSSQRLSQDDESSIRNQLESLISRLESWIETSEELKNAHEIILDMAAMADEADKALCHLQNSLEDDPQRLSELDKLISELHELARKHNTGMQTLPTLYAEKLAQLSQLNQDETRLDNLEKELGELKADYLKQAAKLHENRKQAASLLSEQVSSKMQSLGMLGGQFEVLVSQIASADKFPIHGRDEISFLVSANPGQPVQLLQKVASGGELSRISLAITVICASSNNIPTMIFDEIDNGIGGGVAEIVGKQLCELGNSQQALCVTHLPQVAAQGHHHFRVVKTSTDNHTESRVIALDEDGRIQEIARMLGGVDLTTQSLAHARELLGLAGAAQAC